MIPKALLDHSTLQPGMLAWFVAIFAAEGFLAARMALTLFGFSLKTALASWNATSAAGWGRRAMQLPLTWISMSLKAPWMGLLKLESVCPEKRQCARLGGCKSQAGCVLALSRQLWIT